MERHVVNSKSSQSKIAVIIPTYNEARFIGSTVIKTRLYTDLVIVVDDGSTDDTAEIARGAGAILIVHDQNMGKGMALNTGFRKAMEYGPNVVVTLDGDGQHQPGEIPSVVGPILKGEADIVVGSRYLENRSKVPIFRVLGHQLVNLITSLLAGVGITDSQSGFRAFSASALSAMVFQSKGFSVESEMQFIAREHNLRIIEVPIVIYYKDKPKRSAIGQGLTVFNGILQLVGQYRPLLFFSTIGGFFLLVGLILGLEVVAIYNRIHVLATGYTILSVLLVILGWMALLIGVTLHSIRGLLVTLLHAKGQE